MCFSPEADIIAGVVVTAVGIDTLRHVGHDREAALATLPIVFGIHQLVEVPVWWGATGRAPEDLARVSAWLYLAIAFGLIPWVVPFAVRRLETDAGRRRMMAWLVTLGAVVAIVLMGAVVRGPLSVSDMGNHLDYSVPLVFGGEITAQYVLATCGAMVVSSDRAVRIYGIGNLVAVAVLAVLLSTGVISLWCVWAAVTSIAIAVHLRRLHRSHEAAPSLATDRSS